ncbi:DUF882 domain-containing protein [Pseudovibrio exalbescens]|uniref:DUF882 domain-containing protein n=1 Tax=Pseudovibrio exalbescens TaxID=197461 RepID=UPI0004264112|nr:DUF882 domain-containing protein [Pseudovibrio exalbescens]
MFRSHLIAVTLACCALAVFSTADASAETRTLKLYNTHTKERADITFKRNGRYIRSGLKELNHFMRDWRRNEPTDMDPELFDLIWEVYQKANTNEYIHVVSGYRSLKTNNMLRKRSSGVAKKSQHTQGRAMDFFIPGVNVAKLRSIGLRKHIGGVGYYPRSNTPFVHMDTGSVRHWPRMTRSQLARVFPDGKTIHIPTDGKPLKGYQLALAEIKRRDSGGSRTAVASARSSGSSSGSNFFTRLFTGGDEDEAETTPSTRRNNPTVLARAQSNDPVSVIPEPKRATSTSQPEQPTAIQLAAASIPPPVKPSLRDEAETAAEAETDAANIIAIAPRGKPAELIQMASAQAPTSAVPHPRSPRTAVDAIAALAGEAQPERKPDNIQLAAYAPTGNARSDTSTGRTGLNALLPPPSDSAAQTATIAGHIPDPLATFAGRPAPSSTLMLSQDETARNWGLAYLYHPNQREIEGLTTAVNSIVANGFSKDMTQQRHDRFSGTAVTFVNRITSK